MRQFGLIGKSLGHSYSKLYFETKWKNDQCFDCSYNLYELNTIEELSKLLNTEKNLEGLNVTIPFKTEVIPFLDELSPVATEIQSVNCIRIKNGQSIGHNTDAVAFFESLDTFLDPDFNGDALILGNGGASKSVQWALKSRQINYTLISRKDTQLKYQDLEKNWNPNWQLIINTTPLGMWPHEHLKPWIPYPLLNQHSYLYDLIYNPEKSLFLTLGAQQGSRIKNGIEMLKLQASYSWEFWNE